MKKSTKFFSLLLTVTILLSSLSIGFTAFAATEIANGTCGPDLTWTLDSDGVLTISGRGRMDNYEGMYSSPYKDYSKCNHPWYRYYNSIKSVIISQGVTSIGELAFRGCINLKSITMSNSIMDIGEYAFWECSGLLSVNIPDSVTSIGNHLFNKCSSLESVVLGKGITIIPHDAFSYCSNLKNINIPDNVTSIEYYAFYYCTGLKSVTIGTGVTIIEYSSFYNCTALEKINYNAKAVDDLSAGSDVFNGAGKAGNGIEIIFGDSVEKIPEYLFYCNTSSRRPYVTSVTIGKNVKSIGYRAFYYCDMLEKVNYNAKCAADLSSSGFYNGGKNSGGVDVVIGNSVERIPAYLFSGLQIVNISFSDSTTSIGEEAFGNSPWYKSQPDGLVYAGKVAYRYKGTCPATVSIKSDTLGIAGNCFTGCTELTSIIIPDGVTNIGKYAFFNCQKLTSVDIPDSVTSIGKAAFENCYKLNRVNITDIAAWCNISFHEYWANPLICAENLYCNDVLVTNLVIPDGVTGISNDAFANCTKITSVTIPNSVTSIGDRAFSSCIEIANVTIGKGVISIGTEAFYYCEKITSITIPDSTASIGESAFAGCTELIDITIPDSVTSIGGAAFAGTAWHNNQPDGLVYAGKVAYNYKGTCPAIVSIKTDTLGIAGECFNCCYRLSGISIPNNVKSIGDRAFEGCVWLENVTIGSSVISIGNQAFCQCERLTSIVLPSSVTSIGTWAFWECYKLEKVYIPESVTSISESAFYDYNKPTIYCKSGSYAQKYAIDNSLPYILSGVYGFFHGTCEFTYDATILDNDLSSTFYFDDSWLFADSYAYNHQLATASLCVAMAGYSSTGKNKAKNIIGVYNNLGFNDNIVTSGYENQDDPAGTVAYAIGSKRLYGNTVVLINLRGGGYGDGGWAGNFEVGTGGNYHHGFSKAAKHALKGLENYLEGKDKSKVKIWLTGYSRSAATANLLSQYIRQSGLCSDENIYTYTFATPSNELVTQKNTNYKNIFNIVNEIDLVPQVPLAHWGYDKQGVTAKIVNPQVYKNAGCYDDFAAKFISLTGGASYRFYDNQSMYLDMLIDFLADSFPDRTVYRNNLQNLITKKFAGDEKGFNSEVNALLMNKTTIEELTKYAKDGIKGYINIGKKIKEVINARKDVYGENDPYVKLLNNLLSIVANYMDAVVAGEIADESYVDYSNKMIDFITDLFLGNSSYALMQHWPEVYLAWMETLDESKLFDADSSSILSMKITTTNSAQAPVYKAPKLNAAFYAEANSNDTSSFNSVCITVYDGNNNIVGRTIPKIYSDGENCYKLISVDESVTTVDIEVIGNTTYVNLPTNQKYFVTTDEGADKVNITCVEKENGTAVKETVFAEVLTDNIAITANADASGALKVKDYNGVLEPTKVNSFVLPEGTDRANITCKYCENEMIYHDAVPFTCTSDGCAAYFYCEECGKYFVDVDGETEIESLDYAVIHMHHDYQNGVCAFCGIILEGDVDYDAEVTENDIIYMINMLLDEKEYALLNVADMNNDHVINICDLVCLNNSVKCK